MEGMAKSRKKYIDAVKGVNILIVLFGHAQGIPIIGGLLMACFMQLFFVLAGYTYRRHDNESVRSFAAGKAKRLLVPYFVYTVSLWILDSVLERLPLSEIIRGGYGVFYARCCFYPDYGSLDNYYLLHNWNGQLWFMPALFLSYMLFILFLRCGRRTRAALFALCFVSACALCYCPILLPWSLDTLPITGMLVYAGFLLQPGMTQIDRFCLKDLLKKKCLLRLTGIGAVYVAVCCVNRTVNTSIRVYGRHGAFSVLPYMLLGVLGTVMYLLAFSALEKERWGRGIVDLFAYLGERTITLLGTHVMVYRLLDTVLLPDVFQDCSYWLSLVMIAAALGIGLLLNALFARAKGRIPLFRYL